MRQVVATFGTQLYDSDVGRLSPTVCEDTTEQRLAHLAPTNNLQSHAQILGPSGSDGVNFPDDSARTQ